MTCTHCIYFGHDVNGGSDVGWCAWIGDDRLEDDKPCRVFEKRCE